MRQRPGTIDKGHEAAPITDATGRRMDEIIPIVVISEMPATIAPADQIRPRFSKICLTRTAPSTAEPPFALLPFSPPPATPVDVFVLLRIN